MPTILVVRPGNVICLSRANLPQNAAVSPKVSSEPGPNSSNIQTKQGMEQTTPTSDVSDPDLSNCSFSIRLTWLTSPEASNLSRRPDYGVAELIEQTTKLPTQPQVIVAFPSDSPEFTSSEASHLPCRPKLSDADLMAQAISMVTTPSEAETMILKLMQKYSFNLQQLIDLLRGIVDGLMSFVSSIVAWLIMLQKINWTSAFLELNIWT